MTTVATGRYFTGLAREKPYVTTFAKQKPYATAIVPEKTYRTAFRSQKPYATSFLPARSTTALFSTDRTVLQGRRLRTEINDVGTFGPYVWLLESGLWQDGANWIDTDTWSDS